METINPFEKRLKLLLGLLKTQTLSKARFVFNHLNFINVENVIYAKTTTITVATLDFQRKYGRLFLTFLVYHASQFHCV